MAIRTITVREKGRICPNPAFDQTIALQTITVRKRVESALFPYTLKTSRNFRTFQPRNFGQNGGLSKESRQKVNFDRLSTDQVHFKRLKFDTPTKRYEKYTPMSVLNEKKTLIPALFI